MCRHFLGEEEAKAAEGKESKDEESNFYREVVSAIIF